MWLVAVLVMITWGRGALAQEEPATPVAVIVYIEGPRADSIERQIVSLIPQGTRVITQDFARQLGRAGWRGPMGNIIAVPTHRGALLRSIRKAMREMGAELAIVGRMRKTRALKDEVWLVVVRQGNDELLVDEGVLLPRDDAERLAGLEASLKRVLVALAPAEAAPEEAPAPVVAAPPPVVLPPPRKPRYEAPAEPAPAKRQQYDPLIDLFAGYELGGRWFRYSDPGSLNLRPFTLIGANLAAASAELYPLARTRAAVIRGLGLTAAYARAFGLRSQEEGGEPIPTTYHRFSGGMRLRIASGSPPAPVFGLRGAFGFVQFAFADSGPLDDELAAVYYRFLSGGLDVTLPLGRVAFFAFGDYLGPLLSGSIASRFEDSSVFGFDAGGGVSVALAYGFDLRVRASYTRFEYSFTTTPTDPFVASGARDEWLGLQAGLGFAR